MHRELTKLLAMPHHALVRGEIIDRARRQGVHKLLYEDAVTGDEPTLRAVPRWWAALDVERIDPVPGLDLRDLPACARAVLPHLPVAFHGARLIVATTASHGIKPEPRLRIYAWFDRRLDDGELRRWFASYPAVDLSLFNPVQFHYMAAPVFECPRVDHLQVRICMLPGRPLVAAPSAAALAPAPRPVLPPLPKAGSPGSGAYASAALRGSMMRITMAATGQRHPQIVREARSLIRFVDAGLLGEGEVRHSLLAASAQAGKGDQKEVERILSWAKAHGSTAPLPPGIGR